MHTESIVASLLGGWRLLRDDPVGVLLPGAVVLASQALLVVILRWAWPHLGTPWTLALLMGLVMGRAIVMAPLRALVLRAGARQVGQDLSVARRAPALAVVWMVSAVVETGLIVALLAVAAAPISWMLSRGTWWGVVLIAVITLVPLLFLGIGLRCAFAYAAIEATVGRVGPGRALANGLRLAGRDPLGVFGILLIAELAVALGSLLCGAGALPGACYADLALLHRWTHRQDAP